MQNLKKQTRFAITLMSFIVIVFGLAGDATTRGISIDAGLTPAKDRWIFRTQMRVMQRDNDPTPMQREMKTHMFPIVVAYGIRSNLTLMARQAIRRSAMTTGEKTTTNTGTTDFLVMAKYRLARVNTPTYTFGVAPTLGVEIPIGDDNFSSNSWDMYFGCFFSGWLRSWTVDLNARYVWNSMIKTSGEKKDFGDELSLEVAFAHQFSFGPNAKLAVAPVIESSYRKILSDSRDGIKLANTGESVLLISPGIKVTWSSFILESLIQFPVWQDQTGLQTERASTLLIGIRLMS